MARQRLDLDVARCEAVFQLVAGGGAAEVELRGSIARHELSELQFDVLVVLFALAPRPVTPADLAHYTGFGRSAVSGAIGDLQARGLLHTERPPQDRRSVDVRLTEAGRQRTEAAATDLLGALGTLSEMLAGTEAASLQRFCARVSRGLPRGAPPETQAPSK